MKMTVILENDHEEVAHKTTIEYTIPEMRKVVILHDIFKDILIKLGFSKESHKAILNEKNE